MVKWACHCQWTGSSSLLPGLETPPPLAWTASLKQRPDIIVTQVTINRAGDSQLGRDKRRRGEKRGENKNVTKEEKSSEDGNHTSEFVDLRERESESENERERAREMVTERLATEQRVA